MCQKNCKRHKDLADAIVDDYGNGIKTKFVKKEWGDQLVFAVPECGMNIETVDIIDEIKDEIIGMVDYKLELHNRYGFTIEQVCGSIKDDVKNIFNKYQK